MNRRSLQDVQSKVLNVSLCLWVVGYVCYYDTTYVNPWNLTKLEWIVGGISIRGAIAFYDFFVIWWIEFYIRIRSNKKKKKNSGNDNNEESMLLPTRRSTEKPVRYVSLDTQSFVFLTINAVDEWIFVQRLLHYIYQNSFGSSSYQQTTTTTTIPWQFQQLTVFNTLGALWIMFAILDICYAPIHHILHQSWCYALVHKHHHRQHYPTRGYLDAGNEHPLEHFLGICCTWSAVVGSVYLVQAHAVTIFVFFNIHAALAMLNHSPYNIQWAIPGLGTYSVGNHEMHHRKFTYNYAQYCMWYDVLLNTYAPYEGPNGSSSTPKEAEKQTNHPPYNDNNDNTSTSNVVTPRTIVAKKQL
mmetsp:Transcript_18575/g.28680  ORF Transcript_18575/g.28680 Transcript_18575/m.28680 type:complete len:356 (+) Transcript_18575:58-1125(+)